MFDGAWRVISGQVPFKDFLLPCGLVPIYLQAGFFKIFGISWLAYCIHSSIFNGIFAAIVFSILRMAGCGHLMAALYAVLSALTFYPPFGTPYMEQHAFFFILLFVYVLFLAERSTSEFRSNFYLFVAPIILLTAFMSKQNPTIYAAILLPPFVLLMWKRVPRYFGAGLVFAPAVYFLVYNLFDHELFNTYFWNLPGQLGGERLLSLCSLKGFLHVANSAFAFHLYAVPIVLVYSPILLYLAYRRNLSNDISFWRERLTVGCLLGWILIFICIAFTLTTKNQVQNGIPFAFLGLGLSSPLR